jgi:hypothetical protein
MKIQTLILGLLISFTSIAQTGIQFDKTTYNYGKIKKGIHKSVIFSFLNSKIVFIIHLPHQNDQGIKQN